MISPRFALGLALWVAASCLLAAWAAAQDELASQRPVQRPGPPGDLLCSGTEPSDPRCPRPTVMPHVAVGNYTVRNGSTICLWLEAGLQVQVQYTSKAKQPLWGVFAVQPNHTNASGACSSETSTLQLQFPEGFLLFIFKKMKTQISFLQNETKRTAYLSRVQANLTYQFPQATETSFRVDSSSLQEFEVSLGHSYQCRNRTLSLAGDFRLQVLNEHVQAFELHDGKFGEAEVCQEQRRSALVPIIVFVIIAVLVIIVLVAYAVGRRRSHVGYETL
ncbi:UNVERIFIED_CONTAM: hypothetical protein K2H54_041005 [Gekko kuhli]